MTRAQTTQTTGATGIAGAAGLLADRLTIGLTDGMFRLFGSRPLARQRWRNLLFAHWPVAESVLRPLLPKALALDSCQGSCWVSLVPMQMSDGRLGPLPPLPGLAELCELNLRTYVSHIGGDEQPGVWFFSLDATTKLATWVARHLLHLPFYQAAGGVSAVSVQSSAPLPGAGFDARFQRMDGPEARFAARYQPVGPVFQAVPGSLEHFLTERYYMYMADASGRLLTGRIEHAPWPLQRAQVEIADNTMAAAAGVVLPDPTAAPLAHFSTGTETLAFPPRFLLDTPTA